MFIDPHVHCRDGKQSYKETIAHALSVAERVGMSAIFDMPNTDPPILGLKEARERVALAHKTKSPVFYGLYVGLTADPTQILDAVLAYDEIPEVVGFKLFAGHSTGNLGVVAGQENVYEALASCGYKGMLAVHCEKESLLKTGLWDPLKPMTHTLARPPVAEVASVRDQIEFARGTNFRGTLHIAHISVPDAVDLVREAKNVMKVTCGVTPHHCLLSSDTMNSDKGLLYKMNPPLREKKMAEMMLQYLIDGKIDWIETDHAPHALHEKLGAPYSSGIPGLAFYPRFVHFFEQKMPKSLFTAVTFDNIKKAFGVDVEKREVEPELDLAKEYVFDAYEDVSLD
jgi:dihydroorotase